MQALRPFQRYADFRGRSGRAEYWQFTGLCAVAGWFIRLIDGWAEGGYGATFGTLSLLFLAATIVPQIAVGVRRLHDRSKSGKIYIVTSIVVLIAGALLAMGEEVRRESGDTTLAMLGLVLTLAAIIPCIWVVVQFFKAGDEGSNVYGAPDNAPVDTAALLEPINRAVSAAAAPRPRAPALDDNLQTIERLGKLREQGLITEEEFTAQKRKLLDLGS